LVERHLYNPITVIHSWKKVDRRCRKTLQTESAETFILSITCLNDKKEKTLLIYDERTFIQVSLVQMARKKMLQTNVAEIFIQTSI
jgi:hypothetical protein